MNESTKLEALVKSAMEKVRELSEAETIIGKPEESDAYYVVNGDVSDKVEL